VNALGNNEAANYLNDNFICTYLKVGAFQIINGQKVGGNVASYFCLGDASVVHAVAGQTNAATLIKEARWAMDIRKWAQTNSMRFESGKTDPLLYASQIRKAHVERYHEENRTHGADRKLPQMMPRQASLQTQTHWLLARQPMARLDTIYPIVWQQILNEKLSALPVAQR